MSKSAVDQFTRCVALGESDKIIPQLFTNHCVSSDLSMVKLFNWSFLSGLVNLLVDTNQNISVWVNTSIMSLDAFPGMSILVCI